MKAIAKIICLVGMTFFSVSSYSLSPTDYSFTKPKTPSLEGDFDKYKVKLLKLEDSGLPIKQYIKERDKLINEFTELRRKKYEEVTADGSVTCRARAEKPGLGHGRNQDSCSGRLPVQDSDISNWLYNSHNVEELGQLDGGRSSHSVHVSEDKRYAYLETHCISPYSDDISSGHCDITIRLNAKFKMSSSFVNEQVNAETLKLLELD